MRRLFCYAFLFIVLTAAPYHAAQAEDLSVDDIKALADGGHAEAEYKLGVMYITGNSVPKDRKKAIDSFMKSASAGYTKAQYVMGKLYKDGTYIQRSEQKAVLWFSKAAAKGHTKSQYELAVLYAGYRDSEESLIKSYAWFDALNKNGDKKAAAGREEIGRKLNRFQIIEAKRTSENYYRHYILPYANNEGEGEGEEDEAANTPDNSAEQQSEQPPTEEQTQGLRPCAIARRARRRAGTIQIHVNVQGHAWRYTSAI